MSNKAIVLCIALALVLPPSTPSQSRDMQFCAGQGECPGKSVIVKSYRMLHQSGARPRWAPDGSTLVFDRVNPDGFFDVYLSQPDGTIVRSLTEGRSGIGQRSNGNAIFHPSGQWIVFVSEAEEHFLEDIPSIGDPGIGLNSNLWATDLNGSQFHRLTDIPIKSSLLDPTPVFATVNPNFAPDGSRLVWTERHAAGGNHNWGRWRLKIAEFAGAAGPVRLSGERVLLPPGAGNYVTSMGFFDSNSLLVVGNLDGQHEFGMDHYSYNLTQGTWRNYQQTPQHWEEGACISPNREFFVYMSDVTSTFPLDFNDADWAGQPQEREYWLMRSDHTGQPVQLTHLNDAGAPEHLGHRVIVAACDFSPDGRFIAGTLGVDFSSGNRVDMMLKTFLIEMADPSVFAAGEPVLSEGAVVSAASFTPGLASGGWTSIFGSNLASSTRQWSAADFQDGRLPTELDGVSVTINGRPAPVSFISPRQLNVLAPTDPATGPVQVEVRNASGQVVSATVEKRAVQPAFFRFTQRGGRYAAAVHPDGVLLGPTGLIPGAAFRAARPGDIVLLFGTGFGPTDPEAPTDILPEGPAELAATVSVRVDGMEADVDFAGLVAPGLYQFNVVVPNAAAGDRVVTATVAGVSTGTEALIAIQ